LYGRLPSARPAEYRHLARNRVEAPSCSNSGSATNIKVLSGSFPISPSAVRRYRPRSGSLACNCNRPSRGFGINTAHLMGGVPWKIGAITRPRHVTSIWRPQFYRPGEDQEQLLPSCCCPLLTGLAPIRLPMGGATRREALLKMGTHKRGRSSGEWCQIEATSHSSKGRNAGKAGCEIFRATCCP
jgi:hypothetical protein